MGVGRLKRERENLEVAERGLQGAATTSWTGETESRGWGYQNLGTWGKDPEILGTQA